MRDSLKRLIEAEAKAEQLFAVIEERGIIVAGKSERELNDEIFDLAYELFGIRKYWHKRIVRSGKNTLLPYKENPPDLILQSDDILFFDFGPIFDEWEADYGRTYVIGNDKKKLKLKNDIEAAWHEGKAYFDMHKASLTGADFYKYTCELAKKYGWEFGNVHCGHLIGNFPHEVLLGEELVNYLHSENSIRLSEPDINGNERYWIYEVHFVDRQAGIGGFMEQLVS